MPGCLLLGEVFWFGVRVGGTFLQLLHIETIRNYLNDTLMLMI